MNHNGQLNEILTEMENNYSTAKICPYQPELEYIDDDPIQNEQCNLALEPGRSFNSIVIHSIVHSISIPLIIVHRFDSNSGKITKL